MSIIFFHPAPVVVHVFLPNDDTLHSLQEYILNIIIIKKIIQFSLTFTKIGTFGRDFLFSTCYHSLRKPIKQCSHSHVFFFFVFFFFPSTNIRTTPLDKQATPSYLKTKQNKKQKNTSLKAQPGNSIVS